MPLPGGAADKSGNRYETRWTVHCLLRVIHEKARMIYLEPVGEEGDGVEFRLTDDRGVYEYHQVKRQRSKGAWTLRALEGERILSRFRDKLAGSEDARCVFVSMESAQELRELAERAGSARDAREFEDKFTSDQENQRRLETLRGYWSCTTEQAYRWLRRIDVQTRTEKDLRERVEDLAGWLFEGDEHTVASLLAALALDSIHQALDAIEILAYMRKHGVHRRQWNNEPHLLQRIQDITNNYAHRVHRQSILGTPIARDEAQEVLDRVSGSPAVHAVMLTGGAGSGKTGVLAQVMERASEQGWAVLGFRLDGLDSARDARQLGEQLGLPDSPVRVLAGACHERRCLLVLDQLDAVSMVSGRQPELFECVDEMLRQARMPEFGGRVHVVLSCRTFDLENDTRLRRLVKGNDRVAEEVTVRGLTREVVSDCLQSVDSRPRDSETRSSSSCPCRCTSCS